MATFTIFDKEGRTIHTGEYASQRACVEAALAAGKSLASANLYRWNLKGCNFTSATLTGADLRKCNLANAIFSKATLTDSDISGSVIAGCDFKGSVTTGMTNDSVDLDVMRMHGLHS